MIKMSSCDSDTSVMEVDVPYLINGDLDVKIQHFKDLGNEDLASGFSKLHEAVGIVLGMDKDLRVLSEYACMPVPDEVRCLIAGVTAEMLADEVELELFFSNLIEMVVEAVYHGQSVENEQPESRNGYMRTKSEWYFERPENNRAQRALPYLAAIFKRLKSAGENSFMSAHQLTLYTRMKEAFVQILHRFMMGEFIPNSSDAVAAALAHGFVDGVYSPDFIEHLYKTPEIFERMFDEVHNVSMNFRLYRTDETLTYNVLRIIHDFVNYKIQDTRVFAQMVVNRADFCPESKTKAAGREFQLKSFFGPYLGLGTGIVDVTTHGSEQQSNKFYDGAKNLSLQERLLLYKVFQQQVRAIRDQLKNIFHILLINAPTRENMMQYIAYAVNVNQKRGQMHADYRKHSHHAFMLNLLDVLYQLSQKITLDKVNIYYMFSPKSRVDMTDLTRLNATQEEAQQFAASVTAEEIGEPRFPTECFFLTMHAQNATFTPTQTHVKQMRRYMKDLDRMTKDLMTRMKDVTSEPEKKRIQRMLQRVAVQQKQFHASIMCAETLAMEDLSVVYAIQFIDKQLTMIVNTINPNYMLDSTLPEQAPRIFSVLPEIYLSNILEFFNFLLTNNPSMLFAHCPELAEKILIFLCATHYFKSPFLAADFVDVLINLCPSINSMAEPIWRRLLASPLAQQRLVPSLIKFYADVESTGASSEFYDKFNIRRQIQTIFQALWENSIYKEVMKLSASEAGPDFIRFINMVINDTTFLLDESLSGLRKVHDIESLMADEAAWGALSDEDRTVKESSLQEATRLVKSWLYLGNETMEMFLYLTEGAPDVFKNAALGERLASMLNHNISQLCGEKCNSLKVKDSERFHWKPRKLLEQISQVYLHLFSDEFISYIAEDERSYTPEMFEKVINVLETRTILSQSELVQMKEMAAKVEVCYKEKQQAELDFGDDIPDDFKDPVMDTLMNDPMILPSGHRMDLKHIQRHLLSSRTDPFTRGSLTEEQLVPDTELKKRIDEWKAERMNMK